MIDYHSGTYSSNISGNMFQYFPFAPSDLQGIFFIVQIVAMVNNLLSNGHSSDLLFPVESECQCNIEVKIAI